MYTIQDLASITTAPSIDDISLQLLQSFYDSYLLDNVFCYNLVDKVGKSIPVELGFLERDFCHLLGLHHITGNGTGRKVRGEDGYQRIKRGNVNFNTLRAANPSQFNNMKDRIKHFPLVYQLLQDPSVVQFDQSIVSNCMIACSMFLHDDYSTTKLHLGIASDTSPNFHSKTFIVERRNGTRYIQNQQHLIVDSISIKAKSDTNKTSIS